MKIGIIGAGNIGATLARKLAACGHEVKLANSKGPHTIQKLANEIGVNAVNKEEAVSEVDVVILSIPFANYPDLKQTLSNVPEKTVIIDTSNYYPGRDGAIKEVDDGKPESVWVSEQIGHPVVKAWNAVLAATLADKGQPAGSTVRIALPVAGGDTDAETIAQDLVEDTGFVALAAGTLEDSWRQQPGTPAYCTELTLPELKLALKAADKSRAPQNRDALIAKFMTPGSQFTHEQIVATNRAMTV
ncbi:NADPH-dependent F420 reductase [Pseudomonas fluorescens]|uniref:NAD(P)-binding domain-containing protein n=1 Tax=Pseudomonas fluorescens TaxID=294 RepID=A0A944HDA2_PSEFL|nr:NAD(P)-binding domain-containing protein [Pseudomonas fluorescens]MBT2297592.1 NAD(P)-binding domain-containing protein [Pseudomonas fluorescens]MBT2305790.1 NAD(P)-binding domain-containing protein [Pseudomonas fluorescens]MBT2314187.1 NAD(P)-binding domain-containing protein [Pseudomonas fluorescens]MBT2319321.1 NAD(P)-binding domain-containing protein [Pseudomonas fluorescens]MBT2329262.1 NAD(P)-binding domain-containing protein [Pseudomonas fluorescens]